MEEHKDFYDISWKVPEEEYRADPALSYSSIAKFAREGFKAVSHLGDKIESQALTFGSAVDSIITGGQEEFNSRFFVADFPDIPDSIIQIVKVLFSRYSEEILSLNDLDSKILMDIALEFNYQNNWKPETKAKVICEKGDTYFGLLLMAKDKTILDLNTFKIVVDNTPLISIDFIIKNSDSKILLGKRVNKPAKDYLFTLGGRVHKNEKLNDAKQRILKEEVGLDIKNYNPKFIGVFEHFYNDSFVDDDISTHYVNLAYEIQVSYIQDLPKAQHNSYNWLSLDELINSNEVHKYVKDYLSELGENK